MPFWDEPDYVKSGPIRVDNGIRARSRRGAIGSSWWSRRFIEVLESLELGGRLARGRSYARAGQVLSLEVTAGSVVSSVQGSRPKPYQVRIDIRQIWATHWERVEKAISEAAIFSAKLLAGEMPEDLEDVFDDLGLWLFPRDAGELTMDCTCPDMSVPCKHVAATLYLLAEAFDRDPFLVLTWRGRDKGTLLANLRALRGSPESTEEAPRRSIWDELRSLRQPDLADSVDGYFSCRSRLSPVDDGHRDIVIPDAVLRERDPLHLEAHGKAVTELLRPAYLAMGGD
jgi:uncharacterized Zn finger protein